MEQIDYDVDDFMNYCEVKNLSKKTLSSYEQTLKLLVLYLKDVSVASKPQQKLRVRRWSLMVNFLLFLK